MKDDPKMSMDDAWILSVRGKKNIVDQGRPYAWMTEKERLSSGEVVDVSIIFLTNRECPFHCLMCDLWKNTTDEPVPSGAIPDQIEMALNNLPPSKHLKLYNSGSFFDPGAIPVKDHERIASILSEFDSIIVESHPAFIDQRCLSFRKMLKPDLQIAIGLETADHDLLKKLNKKMTPEKFTGAVKFLNNNEISARAFILLKPPFLNEEEGVLHAKRSIGFAFESGVECCSVIPVRPGNGAMDELMKKGLFTPPKIRSLEATLEYGISLKAGRVFADTWDLGLFSECDICLENRTQRIIKMNHSQEILPPLECRCSNDHCQAQQ